ncbi:MAG: hypothetical protein AAB268_00555 [Elusimicrobiota bacterium]
MKILKRSTALIKGKDLTSVPLEVIHGGLGVPSRIKFKGGIEVAGSCIHCPDTPCMRYTAEDKTSAALAAFPADTTPDVCPTNAMELDERTGVPMISAPSCITCGLCVVRCPVSAITLTTKGAVVNDRPNEGFVLSTRAVEKKNTDEIARVFAKAAVKGTIVERGENFLEAIYEHLTHPPRGISAQFPNLLVRNLMRALGISWEMRRHGDTNVRMDAAFHSTSVGTAEVEFSEGATLDSPRSILDSCAVLVSRHKGKLEEITPAIVTLSFPNARSEYWRVVKDVQEILGIRIQSLTVGALLLLVWERHKLKLGGVVSFYADADNQSIATGLSATLGRTPEDGKGYRGWLKAAK